MCVMREFIYFLGRTPVAIVSNLLSCNIYHVCVCVCVYRSGTFLGYLIMGIPLLCAAACYAELSVVRMYYSIISMILGHIMLYACTINY